MPQVNSYTEATNPASGDWLYLDKSDGAGGYLPRKVSPSRFLLTDGSVTMTGEFVTSVGTFQSNVANGATNTGFVFDAANGAATGFKIASFRAGGVEKAHILLGTTTSFITGDVIATVRVYVGNSNAEFTQPSSGVLKIGAANGIEATGDISVRNGATAKKAFIHGTYTDASNYERLAIITQAGNHKITPEAAGTGTLRNLELGKSGVDTIINVGTSAPADAELAASQFAAWVNEAGNLLNFKVKYADGTTVKSGNVALV